MLYIVYLVYILRILPQQSLYGSCVLCSSRLVLTHLPRALVSSRHMEFASPSASSLHEVCTRSFTRMGGQYLATKVSPFGVLTSLIYHGMTVGVLMWAASSVGASEAILPMVSGRTERFNGRKRVCDASFGPRQPSG